MCSEGSLSLTATTRITHTHAHTHTRDGRMEVDEVKGQNKYNKGRMASNVEESTCSFPTVVAIKYTTSLAILGY